MSKHFSHHFSEEQKLFFFCFWSRINIESQLRKRFIFIQDCFEYVIKKDRNEMAMLTLLVYVLADTWMGPQSSRYPPLSSQ